MTPKVVMALCFGMELRPMSQSLDMFFSFNHSFNVGRSDDVFKSCAFECFTREKS